MNQLHIIFSEYPLAHHAYGIESYTLQPTQIVEYLDRENYSYIFERSYETFKIDDARSIKNLQSEKTEKGTIFVIRFFNITTEAQNALLKVLEEPTSQTYFVLIFSQQHNLLVTLRSRLYLVHHTEIGNTSSTLCLDDYLKMNMFERFEYNKSNTEKKSGESTITKEDIMHFLNECEVYFTQQSNKDHIKTLEEIFNLRRYLNVQSASMKMILDEMAMLLGNPV